MKLFIWNRLSELTDNYHSSGGLVVMAKSLASAKKKNSAIGDEKPDYVFALADNVKELDEVIIFPDAGCC